MCILSTTSYNPYQLKQRIFILNNQNKIKISNSKKKKNNKE